MALGVIDGSQGAAAQLPLGPNQPMTTMGCPQHVTKSRLGLGNLGVFVIFWEQGPVMEEHRDYGMCMYGTYILLYVKTVWLQCSAQIP